MRFLSAFFEARPSAIMAMRTMLAKWVALANGTRVVAVVLKCVFNSDVLVRFLSGDANAD